jgi:hypothetical protein
MVKNRSGEAGAQAEAKAGLERRPRSPEQAPQAHTGCTTPERAQASLQGERANGTADVAAGSNVSRHFAFGAGRMAVLMP